MVRNILGVIVGIVVGLVVNGSLINLGHILVPPPEGFDGSSLEGVAATIHLLEVKHLLPLFLAHALCPLGEIFVDLAMSNLFLRCILNKYFCLHRQDYLMHYLEVDKKLNLQFE